MDRSGRLGICAVALALALELSGLSNPLGAAAFAALPSPTLHTGEDIRHEVGLVNQLLVDRYTWRDSRGRPRSASLVRYGQKLGGRPRGGYAVQLTYQVPIGTSSSWRTVKINPPANQEDAGFGYFVSHEWYRFFDANVCADGSNHCTIASLHGEDDSPLGLALPGSGALTALAQTSATHTFRLVYPHWGTTQPLTNVTAVPTPSDLAKHRRYRLPATIRWQFMAGRDDPLITVTYDLRSVPANVVSLDLRGPYGWMVFDGSDGPLTTLAWGDRKIFTTTGNTVSTSSGWSWNASNPGARFNLLVAGAYEFGLVEAVGLSQSRTGAPYTAVRGTTSRSGAGCPDAGWRMPCDWQWPYQSIQYENFGPTPTRAKKLAWGTAPYVGTTATSDDNGDPFDGYPVVSYRVWLTFDMSSGAHTRHLAGSIH